ncbi:MAG TPA: hypothetical protein ENK50_06810 [Sedimenticola sp.]|nr:hypothetical protein [Sedimenticola sp.]
MKYLQTEAYLGDNECADDVLEPTKPTLLRVDALEQALNRLPEDAPAEERLRLTLDRGYGLLELNRFDEAWELARPALDEAVTAQAWMRAVEACDIMFQCDKPESVRALAHGTWLGVTFPIDPELSVAMLQHIVSESPDRSDGAAVAAATAGYLVDLRAEGKQREDLLFFTTQLLGQVARLHSQVEEQEIFEFWVRQLELDDPGKFLPRLAKVLDVMADGEWWFDRERLRALIPE